MKNTLPFLFTLVLLPAFAQKKIAERSNALAGIDIIMEKILKDRKAAGFAVAVVDKDKIIYSKGFGYRDYEKKLPLHPIHFSLSVPAPNRSLLYF